MSGVPLEESYYKHHWSHLFECTPGEYERWSGYYRFHYKPLLPQDQNACILDVGCGTGHFLYFLMKEGYRNIIGIDRSEDQLAICRDRVGADVANEDALDFLRSKSSRFDLITAHHVVEHQAPEKVVDFVRAMWNATKVGGKMVVTVPNASSPWACYTRYADLTHTMIFADDSLRQLFSCLEAGEVQLYSCGSSAPLDFLSTIRWFLSIVHEQLYKVSFAVDIGLGRRGWRGWRDLVVTPAIIAMVQKR